MTTALRFVDHPAFHRSFLACAAGAALGGAALSIAGGIPQPQLVGGVAGALAGLSWAERAAGQGVAWRIGARLVLVAAAGALMLAGIAGVAGSLAGAAPLAVALGLGLAVGTTRRRAPWVAAAGIAAGLVAAWAGARVMSAQETAGLAVPLTGLFAGISVGLAATLAAAARHVAVVPDPVAAAYRALPPMSGEARELVERGRTMWSASAGLPVGDDNRELVKDGVLRLFSVAGKLASAPAVDGGEVERRIAEIDVRIAAATDAIAREQYVEAKAALVDQRRYVERVVAARERIVARMHHCVATLEKFRMACAQLDATAAAREAADARNAMSVLGELGDGLTVLPAGNLGQ